MSVTESSSSSSSSSSHNQVVIKAVAATAASTILLAGIFFYFYHRFYMARLRKKNKLNTSFRREKSMVTHQELNQQGGKLKGIVVDENGVDHVIYLRKLESGQLRSCFSKIWTNPMKEDEEEEKRMEDMRGDKPKRSESIQETPLLHEPPNTADLAKLEKPVLVSLPSPPPPPPPPPPPLPRLPPILRKPQILPPTPPPLPPNSSKKNPAPPPPPPRAGGLASSLRPPPAPRGKGSGSSNAEPPLGESSKRVVHTQMKLKPLHWDKVTANADHSMVWDEINDGSFRFDDEQMEALFGYNTPNQKSPASSSIASLSNPNSDQPAKIFILEPRKSQNTAIVLRSLAISRREILDALLEGGGLNSDTLEKLTKISPTPEESSKILQFNGNPTKLADAESFLYHILKTVPSAFIRFNAMLFRSNYDPEILYLKESLQALELGCKELRARGVFLKLLEATLKAGNRMNAGTSRGNAQGFNLSALRKLSHVKSTNGKTTLLHFVVEQVARAEGKRIELSSAKVTSNDGTDKEYLVLGMQALGGLSIQFSNVKKAATIDYDNFINMCSNLTARVTEIRELVTRCATSDRGGFVKEMKGFLEECEEELKVVREEQTRVMELVKRTTEYYQAGASKDKGTQSLQLFDIVKDFLDMVDKVCVDIAKKLQKKTVTSLGPSPPLSPTSKTPVTFQNLQSHFVLDKPGTSSDSEDDF